MKRVLSVLIFMSLASCSSMEKFDAGGERAPSANKDSNFSGEHVIATYKPSYKSRSGSIKKLKVRLSPFGGSISFRPRKQALDSKGRELINEMDCNPNSDSTGWICRSSCEGGYMVIYFNRGSKLDRIQLQPFRINLCSGNDLYQGVALGSKSAMNFVLQNVRLER